MLELLSYKGCLAPVRVCMCVLHVCLFADLIPWDLNLTICVSSDILLLHVSSSHLCFAPHAFYVTVYNSRGLLRGRRDN